MSDKEYCCSKFKQFVNDYEGYMWIEEKCYLFDFGAGETNTFYNCPFCGAKL